MDRDLEQSLAIYKTNLSHAQGMVETYEDFLKKTQTPRDRDIYKREKAKWGDQVKTFSTMITAVKDEDKRRTDAVEAANAEKETTKPAPV